MNADGDDSTDAAVRLDPGVLELTPGWAALFMLLGSIATLVVLVAAGALSPERVRAAMVPLGAAAVALSAVLWVADAVRSR
jgi:hypothetical protein